MVLRALEKNWSEGKRMSGHKRNTIAYSIAREALCRSWRWSRHIWRKWRKVSSGYLGEDWPMVWQRPRGRIVEGKGPCRWIIEGKGPWWVWGRAGGQCSLRRVSKGERTRRLDQRGSWQQDTDFVGYDRDFLLWHRSHQRMLSRGVML